VDSPALAGSAAWGAAGTDSAHGSAPHPSQPPAAPPRQPDLPKGRLLRRRRRHHDGNLSGYQETDYVVVDRRPMKPLTGRLGRSSLRCVTLGMCEFCGNAQIDLSKTVDP